MKNLCIMNSTSKHYLYDDWIAREAMRFLHLLKLYYPSYLRFGALKIASLNFCQQKMYAMTRPQILNIYSLVENKSTTVGIDINAIILLEQHDWQVSILFDWLINKFA